MLATQGYAAGGAMATQGYAAATVIITIMATMDIRAKVVRYHIRAKVRQP